MNFIIMACLLFFKNEFRNGGQFNAGYQMNGQQIVSTAEKGVVEIMQGMQQNFRTNV